MHPFFESRNLPVSDRAPEEHWWHSAPLPDGTRVRSVQGDESYQQDFQFDMCEALLPHLGSLHGKRVLDIGAADGFFSVAAAAAGAAFVDAIDLHYPGWPKNLTFLSNAWSTPVRALTGDFRTHAFPLVYDVVFFLGVLYHVEDPFSAVYKLATLVRPGGYVAIETHVSQLPAVPFPVFEAASDVYPSTARQGLDGLGKAGGCNFLFPNREAVYQLAHMYGFSCVGPLDCAYTRHSPSRQLYVFQRLEPGSPRWIPPAP